MINILELKTRALNSRLVTDSFWALIGNVIAKGLALMAGIFVARFLGKDIYGEYGIIRNTLMSIAIFSTFGLGYTATKYIAEFKNTKPEYITVILQYSRNITLGVSGLMAFGLLISASIIAEVILEAPHLETSLRYVAIWIIFNAITTTQIGILAGFGEFKGMARVNTIVGIFTFITSCVFTYLWNLNGALAALLVSQILNWYLNFMLIKQHLPNINTSNIKEKILLKDMLHFSLPVAIQEAIYSITAWVMNVLLIKLTSYGELGIFSAAMQWSAIILFIPSILRNVILSHLVQSNNNTIRHNRVMKLTLLFNFVMTLIPFLIVFFFSGFIASFYGTTFIGLENVINIAVFTTIFVSLSNVFTQAFMSIGKNWLMLILRIGRDIGILFFSFFLLSNTSNIPGALAVSYVALFINMVFLISIALLYNILNKSTNSIMHN